MVNLAVASLLLLLPSTPFQQHGKLYDSDDEELSRRIVWESNRNYVQNHNEHADVLGFTLAMNEFADMVRYNVTLI